MMLAITFLLLSTPSLAKLRTRSARFIERDVNLTVRQQAYTLTDMYQANDFFDKWDFSTQPDPTHGMVNYVDMGTARSKGLATVDGTTMTLSVDDKNPVDANGNRDSIRIESKKRYNGGLFIADFQAMPFGCSVWPAWWSYGPNWPTAGEIDIVEGVNKAALNQYTLHTSAGCNIDTSVQMTGHVLKNTCESGGADNQGCGVQGTDPSGYGQGFNGAGGGVFAHLWDASGIKTWHFARSGIPADITSKNPKPASWGTPAAFFSNSQCDMASHFHDHVLTLNIALCGDWAGSPDVWGSSGCPGTCASTVANPANFANAKWKINYIAVYN